MTHSDTLDSKHILSDISILLKKLISTYKIKKRKAGFVVNKSNILHRQTHHFISTVRLVQFANFWHTIPMVAEITDNMVKQQIKTKVWLLNRELTVPLLGATGALAPGCCPSSVRRFF